MKTRIVLDMADHPTYGFGPRAPTWWGTLAFCALEGTGFALAVGAYAYLAFLSPDGWPLNADEPDLLPGIVLTVLMLVSLVPNYLVKAAAKKHDLKRVRLLLVILSVLGMLILAVRAFEFPALNIWWDSNAYGSLLWLILGLHTTHIATDVADTWVLTAMMFTRHGERPRRLVDVEDNAFYWYFVVGSWIPLYAIIYVTPRL